MKPMLLTSTQLKFLMRLRDVLDRRQRVLRVGHVELALSVRASSAWTYLPNAPVFGFSVLTAISALALSVLSIDSSERSTTMLLIVGFVAAAGILFYFFIWVAGPYRYVSDAAVRIAEADLEDERVLGGLRGRARREAKKSLASCSAPWEPPASTRLSYGIGAT